MTTPPATGTSREPPPSKRPKLDHDKGGDDGSSDDDEHEAGDLERDEEEMTFTACQILCGNLDDSLQNANDDGDDNNKDGGEKGPEDDAGVGATRATAVLDLFLEHQYEVRERRKWSLECVKRRLGGLEAIPDNNSNALLQLQALMTNAALPNSTSLVETIPVWKLVQPAIVSNAHVIMANHYMDQALDCTTTREQQQQQQQQQQPQQLLSHMATRALLRALELWPCNPSALLSLANLERMGKTTNSGDNDNDDRGRLQRALHLYLAAAKCAWVTQQTSWKLLLHDYRVDSDTGDESISDDDKFLVESILLELSAQVECDEHEGEENGNEENNKSQDNATQLRNQHCQASNNNNNNNNNNHNNSKALVIASYMAAMLASTLGQHDLARRVLQRFCAPDSPVTRIHPNVWQVAMAPRGVEEEDRQAAVVQPTQAAFTPCGFPNAISPELFETLRRAFRPSAPYWEQSQYGRNVYYSFWTDWPLPQVDNGSNNNNKQQYVVVSNAIEHYIVTCLLPRVRAVEGVDIRSMKGFEWWVHTRPAGSNLGHQLHFDTDEALLDQDAILDVPLSASVTYLTLDDADDNSNNHHHQFGATLLFDQTPQSQENAQVVWVCKPRSKAFVSFPGDLLHGVLPCISHSNAKRSASKSDNQPPSHRLTFMVNFWGTRIPGRLKERKLYGPSGPFPPRTTEHSWVEDILGGYPRTVEVPSSPISPSKDDFGICSVSPAWESIDMDGATPAANGEELTLAKEWEVPCHSLDPPREGGIHQRFFVKNAPDYFRGTLYEK